MEAISEIIGFVLGLLKLAILLALVVVGVALWGYNTLRRLTENMRSQEAGIGVIAARQANEVNQLLEISTKVQDNEKFTYLKVSDDMSIANVNAVQAQATSILTNLSQMAQRFPELRSNAQFDTTMKSVRELGAKLEQKRLEYNDSVKEYNTQRSSIPHVFYSAALGFRPGIYLDSARMKNEDLIDRPMVASDDGERINQLLMKGSAAALGAGRQLGTQAKLLLDKASSKAQSPVSAHGSVSYLYLDAGNTPQGPVDAAALYALVREGVIPGDTRVFHPKRQTWVSLQDLTS